MNEQVVQPDPKFFERHNGRCDVCGKEAGVEVVSMPGVPASFAYCRECYSANAHPYDMVVVNSAMLGGLAHAAPWWIELVDCTLEHLDIARSKFLADVAEAMKDIEAQDAD